jgi:hypothetical protein
VDFRLQNLIVEEKRSLIVWELYTTFSNNYTMETIMENRNVFIICTFALVCICNPENFSQIEGEYFLRDRGTGLPTSMFGTYINSGEFIIYPFYEFYYDQDAEYKPEELGYGLDMDFRGKYRAHEGLIFLGYGITDKLAIELEASVIKAAQYKAPEDPSAMPDKLEESGLGDVESQIRWRWNFEDENTPEVFSFLETVFPTVDEYSLIGTSDWEFALGAGLIKGFTWGTMTARAAAGYVAAESALEFGEFGVEYLKRVSELFRFMLAVEGSEDEIEFITDLQFHILKNAFIRVNNAFGLTSKATDYAPELGILFHF